MSATATETVTVAAPAVDAAALQKTDVENLHSAIRWGKPVTEIEEMVKGKEPLMTAKDPHNGNQALHMSAQNGHLEITQWLLMQGMLASSGPQVNCVNNKGQTPLHMSVAYDFISQTRELLSAGADEEKKNSDGHTAITGIAGDHVGQNKWDSAVNMLRACNDEETMQDAFAVLELAEPDTVDKAMLIQIGMAKKNALKGTWDHDEFMRIAKKFTLG